MDGDIAEAGVTNVDGYYELSDISPGRYRFQASFVGFETHQDTLRLSAGSRKYNVELTPKKQTLEEVEVEAKGGATRRSAGLQTVGGADLDRVPTPGPSGDLAAYLQTLPGVVSVGDRGGQLYVRGGTPTQNLVLVDNLPITKPFHISGLYSAFPQDIVKKADIHAGGFTAEYMGAISSVIDVTLREGNMKEFVGSASISPFITSARVEGPIDPGRESFLGVVRYSLIDETADPLFGRSVPLQFYDLTGRYSLQYESASCSLTGMRTHDRGQINANRNTVLTWSNTTVGGRCLLFGEQLDHALKVSAGYSSFQNSAGTRDAPERSAGLQKGHFNVEREQDLLRGTLTFGGRWDFTKYEFELGEKFTALETQTQFATAIQGYATMAWDLSDYLTLTPSFGVQFTETSFVPTYEPRLRISFRPDGTDQQELNLAVGKYNQISEGITDERDAGTVFTVWSPSSRDEGIPQALHGILGYRQQIGSLLETSIEGYVKDLSNIPVPQWTPVARFNTRTSLASGLAYGADVRVTLETNDLYFFLGYGWSKVTYEASQEDLGAWIGGDVVTYSPSHDRRHQINAVASYEVGGFTGNLSWEFGSGRPYTKVYGFDLALEVATLEEHPTSDPGTALTLYDEPYGARLPVYHRLDASISRTFDLSSRLSLETKLGAINVYDRKNIFYYDINTLDRVNQTPFLPYISLRVRVE